MADSAAADAQADTPASGAQVIDGGQPPAKAPEGKAPEGKAGDGSKEPEGKAGGPKADEPKAPEKYALTLPDDGLLDGEDLAYLEKVAREAGMTQEEAEAALDMQHDAVLEQSNRWRQQLESDPDYGGDNLTETQKLANLVIERVRPRGHARREAFLRFLHRGGGGNHIEVASFLADLGRMMAEDGGGGGSLSGPARQEKPAEERMYDHPDNRPTSS